MSGKAIWQAPKPALFPIDSATLLKARVRNERANTERLDIDDSGDILVFIYDGEEIGEDARKDHPPIVMIRCLQYVLKKTSTPVSQAYFLPFNTLEEPSKSFKVLCERLAHLRNQGRIRIINASRETHRFIVAKGDFSVIPPLRMVNRRHLFKWGDTYYSTVVTIPDRDVLFRNEFGKIAKGNQTSPGEWVSAIKAAMDGNLYDIDDANYTYEIIKTEEAWKKAMKKIRRAPVSSWDTESENLNRIVSRLGCIQVTCNGNHAIVIPWDHPDCILPNSLRERIKRDLVDYFENGTSNYHIYANAKFDLIRLYVTLGLRWYNHNLADVQGLHQLMDENAKFRTNSKLTPWIKHSNDVLSAFSLEQLVISRGCSGYLRTSLGKSDRSNMFGQPFDSVAEYGGLDAVLTWRVLYSQIAELEDRGFKYRRIFDVLTGQISSTIKAFVRMELTGTLVDRAYLAKEQSLTSGVFQNTREKIKEDFYKFDSVKKANEIIVKRNYGTSTDLFGKRDTWVFDINAVEHQQILFFEVLKLKPLKIGKNGLPAVDKAFKKEYAPVSDDGQLLETAIEEVALFSQYGQLKQLWSSFLKAIYKKLYADPDMLFDGRVRPHYKYLTIVTGRTGACLHGDTPVYTLDERGQVPIKNIRPGDYVWTMNTKTGLPEVSKVKNQWLTGRKPCVEVTYRVRRSHKKWETKTIICTDDHPFLTISKKYKQAGKLKPGDRVMSLERHIDKTGARRITFTNRAKFTDDSCLTEHRLVCFGVDKSELEVHHKNRKRADNRPINLQPVTAQEHEAIHNGEFLPRLRGADNSSYRHDITVEDVDSALKASKGKLTKAAESLGCTIRVIQNRIKQGDIDPTRYHDPRYKPTKEYIEKQLKKHKTITKTCEANGWDKASFNKRCARMGIDTSHIERREPFEHLTDKQLVKWAKMLKGSSLHQVCLKLGIDYRTALRLFFMDANHRLKNGRYTEKMIERASEFSNVEDAAIYLDVSKDEARKLLAPYGNHCIVSVKPVGEHDVYDIEVGKNSNFVANGVFVHNSDPTLQNIPSRSKLAKPIKRQFITKAKKLFLKFDFDSHEVRNACIAANDLNLAKAYMKGLEQKIRFRLLREALPKDWEDFENLMKGFDLHRLNANLFFGIPASEVTKAQRSAVKTVVFGVIYGMSAMRLAATLGISEEEAEGLINTLYERFPALGVYIEKVQSQSRKTLRCVSGIGRVRHMWGYLHDDFGTHNGMDRRGPNSLIQGISSEEGMEAIYQLSLMEWELFVSQGLDIGLEINNSVHDALENGAYMITAPIAAYMIEHAGTTCVHKVYKERYDFNFTVGLEMGAEIGPSLGQMWDWNYRPEQLRKIVEDSNEWAHKELGYSKLTKREWEMFDHNNDVIGKLRRKELRELPKNGVSELMLLDRKLAKSLAVL